MEKNIKDYLPLYLGCQIESKKMEIIFVFTTFTDKSTSLFESGDYKLILRPLIDMCDEEAIELYRITTPFLVIDWDANPSNYDVTRHKDYKLQKQHPNYGFINSIEVVDLRATHDYMNINCNWDILRYNHEQNAEPVINERVSHQPQAFKYLLSKHFDLFGLIEAGLAIDKTTLK